MGINISRGTAAAAVPSHVSDHFKKCGKTIVVLMVTGRMAVYSVTTSLPEVNATF